MPDRLGIAMVGARDSILGFRALGIDVYPVSTAGEAAQAFDECVRRGYAAIFVTEGSAAAVSPQMKALSAQALPAAVIIPEGQESTGQGLARLQSFAASIGLPLSMNCSPVASPRIRAASH